jgi:Rrf2 family protein
MVSVTAKYAIRALVQLAGIPGGQSLGGRDLARRANIPHNYLAKILWTLGSAGLIAATRGMGGGYRLRRPPSNVRLVEIVELFDKGRTANDCFLDGTHPCSDATACSAHATWRQVKAAYVTFLEHTTLATLTAAEPAAPTGVMPGPSTLSRSLSEGAS